MLVLLRAVGFRLRVTLGPWLPAVTASRSSGVRMTKSRPTSCRVWPICRWVLPGGGSPARAPRSRLRMRKKNARLEQGQTNIVAQLTEIAGLLKNVRSESGQDGGRGPGGSRGLGLVPVFSPWGGGAGGGASAPARSNAKEEARREATIRQAKNDQTLWVLRGQRGPEPGPQKDDLQGLMGDIVHVTGDVLAQMRAFSSFNVKSFRPVGGCAHVVYCRQL
ncbi:unnamed protein product [Ectocarpus sp. CCAP 1310/34]|nr:unnamed protein product [Ectocarpus sp. CCAP 1310/34]